MRKIQVLVGMIASGKSTYCRNAAKNGFIIVNDDAIVNMVHADDYTLYSKGLKLLYKSTENHIISTALAMDRPVIVDRGLNISLRGRRRWIALANSFDIPCEAIMFHRDTDETHALRRSSKDSRGHTHDYWLGVAKKHSAEFVTPTKEEGFDSVHFIDWRQVESGVVL